MSGHKHNNLILDSEREAVASDTAVSCVLPKKYITPIYRRMSSSILVTGATGKIGQELVKILTSKGVKFTVFVRDATKLPKGVAVAVGDLEKDHAAFAKACEGHERLFLLTNNQHSEHALAEHAKKAGVKHVVRISCWFAKPGAEQGTIFQMHGHVEQQMMDLGIAVTHLRPADFFQNCFTSIAAIKNGQYFTAKGADTRVAAIDAYDIANCAAAILTAPIVEHAGMSYTITGPQALTPAEYCAALSKVAGKEVKAILVDDESLHKTLRGYGLGRFAFLLVQLQQEYRLQLTGHSFTTGNVAIITGQKPRDFSTFLETNKQAFQGK